MEITTSSKDYLSRRISELMDEIEVYRVTVSNEIPTFITVPKPLSLLIVS